MALRIAAISDVHYAIGPLESCGGRRMAFADILLLRAVHRLNRFIKPDLTVILGDLLDDGSGLRAQEQYQRLKEIIDLLKSPVLVIPGNHDADVDAFYRVFQRPEDIIDINGVRVLTFLDAEEPGYNARRAKADLRRMEQARAGHDGPVISMQHVPLFPPGASASPYSYTNADDAWAAFERNRFTLSISGHWHAGDDLIGREGAGAVIAPALCESPFAFMEIVVDGDRVETRRHELKLPAELGLVDYHVHTPFAYCHENMDMPLAIELARELGLKALSFNEHSGQLYFDRKTFFGAAFMQEGLSTTEGVQDRMQAYLEQARQHCPPAYLGFEIDCDYSGNPVIRQDDLSHAQIRVGAIHWLAELRKPEPDFERAGDEMIARLSKFLPCGLHILAHPFRLFHRLGAGEPAGIISRLMPLLREYGVAVEVNFHTQETSPGLVTACVESRVKLVFGSDSHNLYEVGEFYPHLELMRRCGYTASDLPHILADIRPYALK